MRGLFGGLIHDLAQPLGCGLPLPPIIFNRHHYHRSAPVFGESNRAALGRIYELAEASFRLKGRHFLHRVIPSLGSYFSLLVNGLLRFKDPPRLVSCSCGAQKAITNVAIISMAPPMRDPMAPVTLPT